jgi:hypothetical protein
MSNSFIGIKEKLERYIVKILFNNEQGSGVIVKINDKVATVFTVRHIFESKIIIDSNNNSIDDKIFFELSIDENQIEIKNSDGMNLTLFKSSLFFTKSKELDFCFFLLEEDEAISNLKPLKIYTDNVEDLPINILGYSKYRNKNDVLNKCEAFNVNFYNKKGHDLEVNYPSGSVVHAYDGEIQGVNDIFQGVSGGGAFIVKNGKEYLIGIQKQAFRCDLFIVNYLGNNDDLINSIYLTIEEYIPNNSIEFLLDNKLFINSCEIELNIENINDLDSFLNKKDGKNLPDLSTDKAISSHLKVCDNLLETGNQCISTAANGYLIAAVKQYKNGNNIKAKRNIEKAIYYDESYKKILIELKLNKNEINRNLYENWINLTSMSEYNDIDRMTYLDKMIKYEVNILDKKYDDVIFNNLCLNIKSIFLIFESFSIIDSKKDELIEKFNYALSKKYQAFDFVEDRFYDLINFYKDIGYTKEFLRNSFILLELLRRKNETKSIYYRYTQEQINSCITEFSAQDIKDIQNDAHEYLNKEIIKEGGTSVLFYNQEIKYLKDKIKRLEENSTQ